MQTERALCVPPAFGKSRIVERPSIADRGGAPNGISGREEVIGKGGDRDGPLIPQQLLHVCVMGAAAFAIQF